MKKCPFCAEEIQDAAIICRYCGREIKTRTWRYMTHVLHFRNPKEAGWLWAEDSPAALASQHFYNENYYLISKWDKWLIDNGWEIVEPRGPACIEIQYARDNTQAILSTLSSLGGRHGDSSFIWKIWPSSITLRYRKPAEEESEETWNFWINTQQKKWERIEQDANGKWNIWRRPADFRKDDPNDDRWDKTPYV